MKRFWPADEELRRKDASKIRSVLNSYNSASRSAAPKATASSASKGIVVPASSAPAWGKSSANEIKPESNADVFPELGAASSAASSSKPVVIAAKVAPSAAPAKKAVAKAAPAKAPVAVPDAAPKKILQRSVAPLLSNTGIVGGQKVEVRVTTEFMENSFPSSSQTSLTLLACNDTGSSKILQSVTMDSAEWKSAVKVESDVGIDEYGKVTGGTLIGPQRALPIHISLKTPDLPQVMIVRFSFKFQHKTIKHKVNILVIEEDEIPLAPIVSKPAVLAYRPDTIKRVVVKYDASKFASIRVIEAGSFPGAENAYPLTEDIEARLRLALDEPIADPVWPSRELYKTRMHDLLWMEEMEQKRLIRKFDMPKTKINREFDSRIKDPLFSIEVASLSERRPTVSVGDSLFAWVVGTTDIEYEAYVMSVKQSHVIVAFPPEFLHNAWEADAFFTVRFGSTRYPFLINHRSVDLVDLNVIWPVPSSAASTPAALSTVEPVLQVTPQALFDKRMAKNAEQMRAVQQGLNRREKAGQNVPLLIFGPFGTGKTQTLVELVGQTFTLRPNSRILVCTLSNSAADVVASRLCNIPTIAKSPSNLIRLYANTRKHEQVKPELLPFTYSDPRMGQFDVPPHISSYRIVVMTCANAVSIQHVPKGHFTHIIIDEAAQLLEAEALHPLSLANQNTSIVMAGDPKQLTHRSQSKAEALKTLSLSIMERLNQLSMYSRYDQSRSSVVPVQANWVYLNDNYRSHPALLDYCSRRFYNGTLESRVDLTSLPRLGEWSALENPNFPLVFSPCIGVEQLEDDSPSFFNLSEAKTIVLFIQSLLNDPCASRLRQEDIGVITPFYKQNMRIRQMLRMVGKPNVTVSSINDLQGREFQAVFVSTVRTSLKMVQEDAYQGFGFINNPQALNTVISRARSLVMIVGHPLPLLHDESLSEYGNTCEQNNTLFGRWPTPEELEKMEAEDDRYHTLVTRVSDLKLDRSDFMIPEHRPRPAPIGPPAGASLASSSGSAVSHGSPVGISALNGTHALPKMDNGAPAYQPSLHQPQQVQHANGQAVAPHTCLQDTAGKALTMLGEQPLLVKLPSFDAPDAVLMAVEGRFEVHIATLGYTPMVMLPRPGLIVLQLAPMEPGSPDLILWTSTSDRPLMLEVHQPKMASHFNVEQSLASLKITFFRGPNITPTPVPQVFTQHHA